MFQGSNNSELPPLNPTSNQVYQAPNPTGVRNILIELQRMKKSINGQILAVQSDQDRQIQQTDSQINIVIRELSPKIQNLERHNSFNQQQLDDICTGLSELETSVVPNIHKKYKEIQSKYEQSFKSETNSKFLPILTEIQQEHQKSDQLANSITNNISSSNQNLSELSRIYANLEKQSLDLENFVQANILTITPKLLLIEKKLKALELSTDNSMKSSTNQGDYQRIAKKLRLDLNELESNGIPVAIQSGISDTLANITSITNEIDQKFTSSKLSFSNMDNSIKMTNEQQKEIDSQTEKLIQTSNEIDTTMTNTELEINKKLEELENSINGIRNEISGRLCTMQQNDGEQSIVSLNQNVNFIQDNSQKLFTQLNEDWNGFYADNNKAHSIADEKIEEITKAIDDELGLVRKILEIEEQTKWCKNRIQIWAKENQEKDQLNVSEEKLKEKLDEIQLKIKNAEMRLEQLDNEKTPDDVIYNPVTLAQIGPVPSIEIRVNDLGPMKIPSELKLTYDDHDIEILFPELPIKEEQSSVQELNEPSANPQNDETAVTFGKVEIIQPTVNDEKKDELKDEIQEVNEQKDESKEVEVIEQKDETKEVELNEESKEAKITNNDNEQQDENEEIEENDNNKDQEDKNDEENIVNEDNTNKIENTDLKPNQENEENVESKDEEIKTDVNQTEENKDVEINNENQDGEVKEDETAIEKGENDENGEVNENENKNLGTVKNNETVVNTDETMNDKQ